MDNLITNFHETEDNFILDFANNERLSVAKVDGTFLFSCMHLPFLGVLLLGDYERLTIDVDSHRGVTRISVWKIKSKDPLHLGSYLRGQRTPAMHWLCRCAKHLAALQAKKTK